MKITCFLPCRKGSERVKNKNMRKFANYENGLIEIKLKQLIDVGEINTILLSTNDIDIIKYAESLNSPKIKIHIRTDELSDNQTSTDEIIELVDNLVEDGHILWTHVTSPFLNTEEYSRIIKAYKNGMIEGYDSLMTTTLLKGFIWNENGPISYNRNTEKWPRTQTIKPLYEVNSGVFLTSKENYSSQKDRIGNTPILYPLDKIVGFDIDWPEDFFMAECLLNSKLVKL